jgi:hypothetical protein
MFGLVPNSAKEEVPLAPLVVPSTALFDQVDSSYKESLQGFALIDRHEEVDVLLKCGSKMINAPFPPFKSLLSLFTNCFEPAAPTCRNGKEAMVTREVSHNLAATNPLTLLDSGELDSAGNLCPSLLPSPWLGMAQLLAMAWSIFALTCN